MENIDKPEPNELLIDEETKVLEIIPGKLYWLSAAGQPVATPESHYFCIDDHLVYTPFHKDFGPLDLGQVTLFCRTISRLINDK